MCLSVRDTCVLYRNGYTAKKNEICEIVTAEPRDVGTGEAGSVTARCSKYFS